MNIFFMMLILFGFKFSAFAIPIVNDDTNEYTDEYDDTGASVGTTVAPLAPTNQADAAVNEDEEDQSPEFPETTSFEQCLYNIFGTHPRDSTSTEIVVTANVFGSHFSSYTHRATSTSQPPGISFFLTSNNRFSPETSFRILDTTPVTPASAQFAQWSCGGAERLRRVESDDAYDAASDGDDQVKTAADLNQRANEWTRRGQNTPVNERVAVYYLKAGQNTFRVTCDVRRGGVLAAHQNATCDAEPVNLGSATSRDLKVCRSENKPASDFIEEAIRERERHLRNYTPDTASEWTDARELYERVRTSCSSHIGSDSGAKDAMDDYENEMNERIRAYNRRRAAGTPAVPAVVQVND